MFIGQAVYDFVKKNRGQAKRRLPAKSQRAQRPKSPPQRQRPTNQANTYIEKSRSPEPRADEPINYGDMPTGPAADEIEESEFTSTQDPATQSEELRRAVIWSEILKRKF